VEGLNLFAGRHSFMHTRHYSYVGKAVYLILRQHVYCGGVFLSASHARQPHVRVIVSAQNNHSHKVLLLMGQPCARRCSGRNLYIFVHLSPARGQILGQQVVSELPDACSPPRSTSAAAEFLISRGCVVCMLMLAAATGFLMCN
jgi:hypothetical protein